MVPVSVVIITKNEADVIASCINAARQITDDIIIIDNGSHDATTGIALAKGCRVYHENWDGYGANKNKGILLAKYNWILSIDADEVADTELIRSLHQVNFDDPEKVYDIRFISYYGQKAIRFGTWGRDHHIRLFNRKLVRWSEPKVHESLMLPPIITVKKLEGRLHHYSVKDSAEFMNKTIHYAKLSAGKYLINGKKASVLKLYLAPIFHFVKNYIVFLGFLDGSEGLKIARMIAKHTRLKYHYLKIVTEYSYLEMAVTEDHLAMQY